MMIWGRSVRSATAGKPGGRSTAHRDQHIGADLAGMGAGAFGEGDRCVHLRLREQARAGPSAQFGDLHGKIHLSRRRENKGAPGASRVSSSPTQRRIPSPKRTLAAALWAMN
jgi:hypothetical protein